MQRLSRITHNTLGSDQSFWIDNNGKPLLIKPLNNREITELVKTIMVNIKTTRNIMRNS